MLARRIAKEKGFVNAESAEATSGLVRGLTGCVRTILASTSHQKNAVRFTKPSAIEDYSVTSSAADSSIIFS